MNLKHLFILIMLSVHICAFGQATDSIVSTNQTCPSTAQAPVVQQVTIIQSQAENNDAKKQSKATSGQSPKASSTNKPSGKVSVSQQQTISQLQDDNNDIKKQLEELKKEIDIYREDVRHEKNQTISIVGIICAALFCIVGILIPYINNNRFEKRSSEVKEDLKDKIADAKAMMKKDADDSYNKIQKRIEPIAGQVEEARNAVKELNKIKDAVEKIQNTITEDKNATEKDIKEVNAYVHFVRAYYFVTKEEFYQAIDLYTKAINLNDNFIDAYYNRGIAEAIIEDWKAALNDFNKIIDLNPTYAPAYSERGSIKLECGDLEGALEDYNTAIKIDKNLASAYERRSICYRDLANKDLNKQADFIALAEADKKRAEELKKQTTTP